MSNLSPTKRLQILIATGLCLYFSWSFYQSHKIWLAVAMLILGGYYWISQIRGWKPPEGWDTFMQMGMVAALLGALGWDFYQKGELGMATLLVAGILVINLVIGFKNK